MIGEGRCQEKALTSATTDEANHPSGKPFRLFQVGDVSATLEIEIMAAIFNFFFHVGSESPVMRTVNYVATIAWAIYYGFTKDGHGNGQSMGKKLFHLIVVTTETNEPCSLSQSIGRALVLFVFSAIPVLGWLIEPIAAAGWPLNPGKFTRRSSAIRIHLRHS